MPHSNAPYSSQDLIRQALLEDLGERGEDITSIATIPADTQTYAIMRAREDGIVAGLSLSYAVFEMVDPELQITSDAKDGETVKEGSSLLRVRGSARSIFAAERVALNFASHMSGIATITRAYVDEVAGTNANIYDTRKTLPALRQLQKVAVVAGGGVNHRFGLYDAILIKDNHIAVAGGIEAALDGARISTKDAAFTEIEVDNLDQLREVLSYHDAHGRCVDVVMLDNMSPALLKEAVGLVDGRIKTEASGGVNLNNVRAIAKSGVDIISVGALTHSVQAFDIGLDIDPQSHK